MSTVSYFVYYRTDADPAQIRRIVERVQRELAQATGVRGRLMRRADDPRTWMEVYEAVADAAAFERAAEAALERAGFARLLAPGERRHVERFVPG
jgi:hypothetical protein